MTTNHVLALEIVLPSGEAVRLGSAAVDAPGYDLTGLFVGSEGTFGLVTEITVKLTRNPEAVKTLLAIFDSVDDATETVAEITARGITPAACEMLDGWTIRAVEEYVHAGFPLDCAGDPADRSRRPARGDRKRGDEASPKCARRITRERCAWLATRASAICSGRAARMPSAPPGALSPSYYTQDGVIPRTKLPATLRRIDEIGKKYGSADRQCLSRGRRQSASDYSF